MAPAFSAQVPSTINYQGYLTNSSGVALDGSYTLTFELFDAATAGASMWGPETHTSVPVARGIFHVALGSIVALQPNDFDKALFLNVKVNGESMTPRQPLQTVPYAFGLVPGAEIGPPIFALMKSGIGHRSTGCCCDGSSLTQHHIGAKCCCCWV